MKLINAAELAAALRDIAKKTEDSILESTELDDYDKGLISGFSRAAILAENFPAFDAEPITRCRDCINWNRGSDECPSYCGGYGQPCEEDDFCSYGERR